MSIRKTWVVALLFVCACSTGSKGESGSGGRSGSAGMHGGSSGSGGSGGTSANGTGGSSSATGGMGAQGSGGKIGTGSGGECIAEGADCRQTTKPCCDGLLCSQTEMTCLLKCTQAGECLGAFNQGRAGAKGMCCATMAYDPANSSTTGLVCGARCPP